MARMWDIAERIQADSAALVDDEQPSEGRVVVTWLEHGEPAGVQCDGWIAGDILFVPFDGQSAIGSNFDADGRPDGAWYETTSGRTAIVGLAGAPLAILA